MPFQSRWGFHPCDYATFRKLKFLNLVYQRAVHLAHAWMRWKRKDPHNRVIRRRIRNAKGQTVGYEPPLPMAEPPICPMFSRKVQGKGFVDKKGTEETVVTDEPRVATDYSTARKPASEPGAVAPLSLSLAEIDELYEKARAWVEKQDVA